MRKPFSKWALLALLFLGLVVVDQWTKFLAVERLTTAFATADHLGFGERVKAFYVDYRELDALTPRQPYYVYKPLWRMNYVENPGAAWGLFRSFREPWRTTFFVLVSLAAVAFILRYYRKIDVEQRFLQVALAFVLAGAVGNFIDRLARQYVIDFVEWYWWRNEELRWPTFNVADSLIVVGVIMLVLHPGQKKASARADEAAADAS
jgi:signal peptidase II